MENSSAPQTALDDGLPSEEVVEFTSELFKIQMYNIPKFARAKQLKDFLKRKSLTPKKVTVMTGFAYVTFPSEEVCASAIHILQDCDWKGNKIRVKRAAPKPDPCSSAP